MKPVATPCMIAVPSMLMVAPRGTVNEPIELSTPRRRSTVSRVTGSVAPELAVLNANATGARILRRKTTGLRPASNRRSSG